MLPVPHVRRLLRLPRGGLLLRQPAHDAARRHHPGGPRGAPLRFLSYVFMLPTQRVSPLPWVMQHQTVVDR